MKLVQLLAKELKEWPESVVVYFQRGSGEVFATSKGAPKEHNGIMWYVIGNDIEMAYDAPMYSKRLDLADDHDTATVTKSQWQAEREKMNKPKWIRHRGGKCPVKTGTKVSTRHRDGYICATHFYTQNASSDVGMNLVWSHKGDKMDIMAYRVIEETKDQEIEEVKDTNIGTLTYKLEIDATEATKQIDSLVAKWGQIESPLKWRDAIIHCQSIIEDCEREIERNVNLLDSEGLMMQKDSKNAMQHYQTDIDMSDWRNWKRGDIVSISNDPDIKDGEYKVTSIEEHDYDGHFPVQVTDGWADFSEANVKFIRRP